MPLWGWILAVVIVLAGIGYLTDRHNRRIRAGLSRSGHPRDDAEPERTENILRNDPGAYRNPYGPGPNHPGS